MNRRNFQKQFSLAALGLPLANKIRTAPVKIKAKSLKKGDTIGVLSPGSYLSDKGLEKGVKNLESLGLKVKLSKNIRAQRGFNAGTDEERLDDLHSMFADREIAGIWCARGGYGCTRLLSHIDYDLVRNNPKVFIGYSDITALLQAFYIETGLIGFHGPVASSDFNRYTKRYLKKVLFKEDNRIEVELSNNNKRKGKRNSAFQTRTISDGRARGKLVGGNLSLLASLAGTRWELDASNKLVFMEDIGEKPYRIDRMLTQLRQSAHLNRANGIALGIFEDCEADKNALSLSLEETLDDQLTDLDIPVLYGLSFGHISEQMTIPYGIEAEMDTRKQTLTFLESGVV